MNSFGVYSLEKCPSARAFLSTAHAHKCSQARAAVQHTHSQARAAVQHTHTHKHQRGPLCNTRTHKRGPLYQRNTHAHKARAAVQDTNAHKRGPLGRCAGHKCSQARDAVQHTRTQSEGRCNTLYRYIYSHSGPIYIASRGCCRGHVCFMRLGCCWGRFRFPFLYKNIRLFIKTYARVYVSAARAAIFLSKVGLFVPSYRPRN